MGLPCSSESVMFPLFGLRFLPKNLYRSQGLLKFSALLLKKFSLAFLIARVKMVLALRNSCLVARDLILACLLREVFRFCWRVSRSEVHQDFEMVGCLSEHDSVAVEKIEAERSCIARSMS